METESISSGTTPIRRKVGRPKTEVLRWSVERASNEFGHTQDTVRRRINASGIMPGEDGKWSSIDIATALYGGEQREKLLAKRADRQLKELSLAQKSQELVVKSSVEKVWGNIVSESRNRLYKFANKLPSILAPCRNEAEMEKIIIQQLDECLQALSVADIPIPVDEIGTDVDDMPLDPSSESESEVE